jgi:hypothetical protein
MPVLYINTWFRLPDGFKGDLNDALLELVKYRRAQAKNPLPGSRSGTQAKGEKARKTTRAQQAAYELGWKNFLLGVCQGFRHVGVASVNTITFDGPEWRKNLRPAKKSTRR